MLKNPVSINVTSHQQSCFICCIVARFAVQEVAGVNISEHWFNKYALSKTLKLFDRMENCFILRLHETCVVLLQVFLDPKDRTTTEYKLDTFTGVYKKLTGKEVVFEYPLNEAV